MTERLYYRDSFLYDFDGEIVEVIPPSGSQLRHGIILDRTAFYPTSGGQVHDTGWMAPSGEALGAKASDSRMRVAEVADLEDGRVIHYIEAEKAPATGTRVFGSIDSERRRDHMRQHSGQHVLSAAFVRLFNMPTVSFHMAEEYCSIDLDTQTLSDDEVIAAERLANQIILENRPVDIRFVTQAEARDLGLRKMPPPEKAQLRLIDIRDFDLTACGGTHVSGTGQVGSILLRKTERVRQGWRVEFVAGERAITTARRDYTVLSEAAGLFSTHLWDVTQQIRKAQDEARAARKSGEQLQEEIAELHARQLLAETAESNGRKVIVRVFVDRDVTFIKLLAQKLIRLNPAAVVFLGTTAGQPSLVFAQSPGQPFDMGAIMKDALSRLGGRGGGSKDMAQGGVTKGDQLETLLKELAAKLF